MKLLNQEIKMIQFPLLISAILLVVSSGCRKEMNYGTIELPSRLLVTGQQVKSPEGFNHPGVLLSITDLNNLREQKTANTAEYLNFSASNFSSITYKPAGPFKTVSRGSGSAEANLNRGAYESDATAILYQAVQWYITGDTTYAGKAMRMLKGWTTTHTDWGVGGEQYFIACEYGGPFMMAGAEILKYTYPGWTAELNTNCINYCKTMLYPLTNVNTGAIRRANQGSIQLMGAMQMAVFCDDRDFYNKVLDIYHNDACAGIIATLPNGQNPDSGRDCGHGYGYFAGLAEVAETAWIQGLNLYSELDNRILAMAEYHSRYNLGENVEYKLSGACYDWYLTINEDGGAADRGQKTWNPNGYALVSSAYARLGVPAPNAVKYLNHLNAHPSKFLFTKKAPSTAGTIPSNLLPVNFVMTPITTGLIDKDMANIGSIGLAGSSSFSDGVWTLTGSSNITPSESTWNMWYNKWLTSSNGKSEPVHFAYKELTGNGEIVAKVTSLNLTNGFMTVTNGNNDGIRAGAGAGLMIRTSLDEIAGYVLLGVVAGNSSTSVSTGVQIQSRGFTASSNNWVNYFSIEGPTGTKRIPFWLKLSRRGNRVMGYCSDTGEFWTPMNVFVIPETQKIYIGLFANSDDKSKLATATFTDVKLGN